MSPPSSGVFSTNKDFIIILSEMVELAKKEILSTSLVAQTCEDSPIYIYTLGKAIDRGVRIHYILSNKTPSNRIHKFKEIGIETKVVEAGILQQHRIPNIQITDKKHFLIVDKYAQKNEQKIRFGFWGKYDKKISKKYVKSFLEVWKSKLGKKDTLQEDNSC
jgi:hypothetical protein